MVRTAQLGSLGQDAIKIMLFASCLQDLSLYRIQTEEQNNMAEHAYTNHND